MAGRLEKLYEQKSKITRRSQKNQLLYQQIDEFSNLTNNLNFNRIDEKVKSDISRLEKILDDYNEYKKRQEQEIILKRKKQKQIQSIQRSIYSDFQKKEYKNSFYQASSNILGQTHEYNSLKNDQQGKDQPHTNPIQSRKIEPSRTVNTNNPKSTISQVKDLFPFQHIDSKQIGRNNNLKIKFIVGTLFLINTFIIILIIYINIK